MFSIKGILTIAEVNAFLSLSLPAIIRLALTHFLFLSLFNHFVRFQLQIKSRPDVMRRQLTFCPLALLGLAREKSGTPGRLLG